MRKWGMRGLLAALLCAAVVTTARAAAAEDDDEDALPTKPAPSGITAWWDGLFGSPPKPVEKVEKKKAARPPKPAVSTAAQREALKDAYCRRLKVCDTLRAIALEKNDAAFEERINILENTIFEVYQQRMANLGQGTANDDPQDKPQGSGAHRTYRNRTTAEDDQ